MAQATATTMKLLGVRNMSCVVERMEWNNKMDLIAYGTEKGEVIIQRLNWQKIVTFPTPGDEVRVRSLSWQTDETLLAVGYSNGKVALLDAERETMISGLIYEDDIKKVYFTKAIRNKHTLGSYTNDTEDMHTRFLLKLPPLTNIDPTIKPIGHKSFPKGSPCFLVVIMNSGKVHLLLLGALQAGCIDLTQHVLQPDQFEVYDVRLNGDFTALYALLRDGNQLKLLHFHNEVLQQCMPPMLQLALHCANILETKNYINDTLQCIVEAWETVLLEMDNKLTKYAGSQPDGLISAHFLELFLFGFATLDVEGFLTDELTEKGFKKIANSVDLSLTNLQSLVAKQLNSAGVYMYFFLNMTNGYGRVSHFFEPLIAPEAATDAMRACGAFMMKIFEMQQTINTLVHEMKLFHCWMCLVILRLSHQDIPDEMQMATEENFALTEYLYAMEEHNLQDNENGLNSVPKSKFNLEKVGQYLENADLCQISKIDTHHLWSKVMGENECLRDCAHFIPHDQHLSLIQQRDKMLNAIDVVFRKPTESISASFTLSSTVICSELPEMKAPPIITSATSESVDIVNCSFYVNDAEFWDKFAITIGWQEIMVLEIGRQTRILRCMRVHLQPGPFTSMHINEDYKNLRFIDLQFYNDSTISMLTQTMNTERPRSYFMQFSLRSAQDQCTQHQMGPLVNLIDLSVKHSIHELRDNGGSGGAAYTLKALDGICEMIAVSGSRKVATILSDRKRKMTIYEMETDEEEDDAEMSQSSLLEMSKEAIGVAE